MASLGFNLLRLPLNWSAFEPQPGAHSSSFLDTVAKVVTACQQHGIVGFEIFNEPVATDEALLAFHTKVAQAIRRYDPDHLIAF